MHCLQSSSVDKMCNCLFPDFPLCTDMTELCLNYYLLPLPVVGVFSSRFPSLVTPISSGFGWKAVRIAPLLLRGQGSASVGLEQRAARAGGTRQAAHKWLTSRRVICCLSHISLSALYPLKETPVSQRLIPVFQLSLTRHITSVADQQEILPRVLPGCLAEIVCSFLPFPLLKHHVLSSHTPPRQQKARPGLVGGERRKMSCSLKSVTASRTSGLFFPSREALRPPAQVPLPIQGGVLVSQGLMSFNCDLFLVQYFPYKW